MRQVAGFTSLIFVLSFAACSSEQQVLEQLPQLAEAENVSKTIGPDGGVIEMDGVSLSIPPHALHQEQHITITRNHDFALYPYMSFSDVWSFSPSGLEFHFPATVRMEHEGAEEWRWLFWSRSGEQGFDALPFRKDGDTHIASIDHFSTGFIGSMEPQTDIIDRMDSQPLDLLLIVDNSCSMYEEQEALLQSAPGFFNEVDALGVDWQLGIVTTDMDNASHQGSLHPIGGVRFLDATVPDPVGKLEATLPIGTSGSVTEKGLAAAWTAIEVKATTSTNAGFYRDEAHLAMVVISDENDQTPISNADFIDWAQTLKHYPEWVSFSSIVGPMSGCSTAAEPGEKYIDVTNAVGGKFRSVCSLDYSPIMSTLTDFLEYQGKWIALDYNPVQPTIVVTVVESDGTRIELDPADWEYFSDSNSVHILMELTQIPLDASIEVTYTPLPI